VKNLSVLVVGGGAREHALAWKLRQSPEAGDLYVAPGNVGTSKEAVNVPIAATDIASIARFVEEKDVSLTVVGPEAPLALGLADRLRALRRMVVGPSAAAARVESSKAFAKEQMRRSGVPAAEYAVFDSHDDALRHVDRLHGPMVIKADGLCAGKGVVVCGGRTEARTALRHFAAGSLGEAGRRVVIEELLVGAEISLLALVDGERAVALEVAQDHKRLGDGDVGPNTGGMGAYAPVPFVDGSERERLMRDTVEPVVRALAEAGTPYRGVLFAGLMLTPDGPRVLEYNCRLGDPEAQAVLPLIDGDLLPWLLAVADGKLAGEVPVRDASAVGVVLAAAGYPEEPRTGEVIHGLDEVDPNVLVFHAGTAIDSRGAIVTAGGRVLTVVGLGESVDQAAGRAYSVPIVFEGVQRRLDIGWQARNLAPSPTSNEHSVSASTLQPHARVLSAEPGGIPV